MGGRQQEGAFETLSSYAILVSQGTFFRRTYFLVDLLLGGYISGHHYILFIKNFAPEHLTSIILFREPIRLDLLLNIFIEVDFVNADNDCLKELINPHGGDRKLLLFYCYCYYYYYYYYYYYLSIYS